MECRRINNLVQQLAVSADEVVCAMKQLNELAKKTIGPYSEEELQLRRINGKRKKKCVPLQRCLHDSIIF